VVIKHSGTFVLREHQTFTPDAPAWPRLASYRKIGWNKENLTA
jgi:hypothetical protein